MTSGTNGAILGAWVPSQSSYGIRVTFNSATENLSVIPTVNQPYYLSGDGDSDDLIALIQTTLQQHSQLGSISLTRSGETVSSATAATIEWSHPSTVFPSWILGFGSTDDTLDNAGPSPLLWLPGVDISYDTRERPSFRRAYREALSGAVFSTDFGQGYKTRQLTFELLNQEHIAEEYAGSTYTAFDRSNEYSLSKAPFRIYDDDTTIAGGTGFSEYRAVETPRATRNEADNYRWDVFLRCRKTS